MLIYLLIIIFIFSRLANLMHFPPFMDETIYIRWLTTIKQTNHWLLPLKEFGWAPLTTWISAIISFITQNNLLSLRLTAGIFGGLSLFIAYKLSQLLFNNKITTNLTLLLIILSPIVLIHDRLGLRGDSAVTFASLLLLYGLTNRLIKKKPTSAYLIGISIALGLLIKSTAWIFPIMTISAYLVFRPKLKKPDWLGGLIAGSSLLFYLLTNSLPAFLNKTNVFLTSQFTNFPKNNLIQTIIWSYEYLSLPILVLIFLGVYLTFKTHKKIFTLLTVTILPALIFDLLFAKIFFPRYLLFIVVYALFFAGFTLNYLIQKLPKYLSILLIVLIFLPNLILDTAIIQDIKTAKLPEIERWQYVEGWPSGYSLPDLVDYLKTDTPDTLIVEQNDLIKSGLPYLWSDHPMEIIVLTEDNLTDFQLIQNQNTYLALNILENLPDQFEGALIQKFPRPANKTSIKLYKILDIK